MLPEEILAAEVPSGRVERAKECLRVLTANLDHRDLAPVATQLAVSYGRLAELGMPANAIAAAMVLATLNFYSAYSGNEELPSVLRAMADLMETQTPLC